MANYEWEKIGFFISTLTLSQVNITDAFGSSTQTRKQLPYTFVEQTITHPQATSKVVFNFLFLSCNFLR